MKSLKPIIDEASLTLVASDVKQELDNKIASIQTRQNKLENEVDDLSTQVSKKTIVKENVTADTVNTSILDANTINVQDGNIENIVADDITANGSVRSALITSDEASISDATIHHLDTDELNATDVTASKVTTDEVNTKNVTAENVTSVTADVNSASITILSTDELKAKKLGSPNRFDAASIKTDNADIVLASIEEANIKLSEEEKARVKYLYNQMKAFCDDETDAKQFLDISDTESSDTTNKYHVIRVPRITSGWYRLELKSQANNDSENHDGNTLFSINYYQAEKTPIIQYTKTNSGDLSGLYYDDNTGYLYVKTYGTGKLYWASDAKDFFGAPTIVSEAPEEGIGVFHFPTARKHQWVMMGNNSGDYGLTVQGVIEGDIIKDTNEIVDINFYGNDTVALFRTARSYLKRTFNSEDIYGHSVEVYGYLYHTDGKTGGLGAPYTVAFKQDIGAEELPDDIPNKSEFIDSENRPNLFIHQTVEELLENDPMTEGEHGHYGWGKNYYVIKPDGTLDYFEAARLTDGVFEANIYGEWFTVSEVYVADLYAYKEDCAVKDIEENTNFSLPNGVNYLKINNGGLTIDGFVAKPYKLKHFTITPTDYSHYEYRDHWGTEVEALEKICLEDKNTLVLTVDSKYGQDDIVIDLSDEEGTWVEHSEPIELFLDTEWKQSIDAETNDTIWEYDGHGIEQYKCWEEDGEYIPITKVRKHGTTYTINDEWELEATNVITYFTNQVSLETLPFVVGLSFRTATSDMVLNINNFQGDSSVL